MTVSILDLEQSRTQLYRVIMLKAFGTRTCSPCATPCTQSKHLLQVKQLNPSVASDRNCRYTSSGMSYFVCCSALWSRQPDEWDIKWEEEEALKKQHQQQVRSHQGCENGQESACAQQLLVLPGMSVHTFATSEAEQRFVLSLTDRMCSMQVTIAQQAAEQAAWRQQVDHVHQQLIDQQKHRAALRQRLQQDALRAKQEELRRIQPVAKARARAHGLFNLGLDPQILSLSEKLGQLSGLVDEVQQRMEEQYGAMGSLDDAMYAQLSQQVDTTSRPFAAVQTKAGYQDLPPSQQQLQTRHHQQAPITPYAAQQQQLPRELAEQQQDLGRAVQQWSPSLTATHQQAQTPKQHHTPPQ